MKNTLEEAKKIYQQISTSSKADDKLFSSILNKCIVQTETAFYRDQLSLQEICAATRYNLEALITIKLCNQNEADTMLMEFQYDRTFINLLQNQINQYEREIKILEDYQQKDDIINKDIDVKNFKESFKKQQEKVAALNQEFLEEPIYLMDVQKVIRNGFSHSASQVKEKILVKLKQEKAQQEKKLADKSKKLRDDFFAQFSFSFNDKTSLSDIAKLTELEFTRWSDKAKKTDLRDEYYFIYNYTSNLIHCVSVSFYTTPDVQEADKKILVKASTRYLKQIVQFIKQRLDPEDIKIFIPKRKKD